MIKKYIKPIVESVDFTPSSSIMGGSPTTGDTILDGPGGLDPIEDGGTGF